MRGGWNELKGKLKTKSLRNMEELDLLKDWKKSTASL
jgi:hypothetical protein